MGGKATSVKPTSGKNGTTNIRDRMSNMEPHDDRSREPTHKIPTHNVLHRQLKTTPVGSPTDESTEAAMLREHGLAHQKKQKKPSQDAKAPSMIGKPLPAAAAATMAAKRRNSSRERPLPSAAGGLEGESTEDAMMREHGRPPSFREKSSDNIEADVNMWKLQQDVAVQVWTLPVYLHPEREPSNSEYL